MVDHLVIHSDGPKLEIIQDGDGDRTRIFYGGEEWFPNAAAATRIEELEDFLVKVKCAPDAIVEIMRDNRLVIDNHKQPMQKLAFTMYSRLVALASAAKALIGGEDE